MQKKVVASIGLVLTPLLGTSADRATRPYLGQEPPGSEARLCAREDDGRWSLPEVATFSGDPTIMDLEPAISPDGRRFFFMSNRPRTGRGAEDRNEDIWVMDRQAEGWGAPYNLGPRINPAGSVGYSAALSPDGKYFFFASMQPKPSLATSGRLTRARLRDWGQGPQNGSLDIYWIETQAIEALRPTAAARP